MSAYALPGLFPPLPKTYSYDYSAVEVPSFQQPCSESRQESSSGSGPETKEERLGISVKEAKINSALLVQSLAKNDKVSYHHHNHHRRKMAPSASNSSVDSEAESQDEAMQFELSVTFGGRKYSATRSWPSIQKFRKDLICNLRSQKIPELPSLYPSGVLCRSFSFLHNLVSSYVPTLEGWLKDITALVPHDNPILSHFLQEAETEDQRQHMGNNLCSAVLVQELEKRSNSCTQLDAIEETEVEDEDEDNEEDEDDDDDDDDEW